MIRNRYSRRNKWAITAKGYPKLAIEDYGHYRIQPEHFRAEIGYMLLPDIRQKNYYWEKQKP
jgi:ribosomal-protein-alanine N-acetyltransferase